MNLFFDSIKNLYIQKNFNWLDNFYGQNFAIGIIQVLKKNNNNLKNLKKIIKYIYILSPDNLLILLHAIIPKVYRIPFFKSNKKNKLENNEGLHIEIQKYFNYSNMEYNFIKGRINELINRDLKKYYTKFGLKYKKGRIKNGSRRFR